MRPSCVFCGAAQTGVSLSTFAVFAVVAVLFIDSSLPCRLHVLVDKLNVLARLDIVVRNRRTRLPTYVVRCEIAFTRLWLSKALLRIGFDAGLDLFVHICEENMYPGYCHDDEGMLYRTVGCQTVCAA